MRISINVVVALLSMATLSACGAAPTVKSSKYYDAGGEKVDAFEFVYYKSRMSKARTVGAPSPYRKATTGLDDIRYESFGGDLVKVAGDIFKAYGVMVRDARESEIKLVLGKMGAINAANSDEGGDILYLFASSGKVTTNRHMVRANYVFDALLLDPAKRKVKWRASIDTSAWAGRDFVMKTAEATVYDETYAKQLLTLVAERMKSDGVI